MGQSTENNAQVYIWDCHGGGNQQWTLDERGLVIGSASGRCLDVVGQQTANGSPVQIWDCHGLPNQRWHWTPEGMLQNDGSGRCLDVVDYGTANASALQIYDCHGGSNQRWRRPLTYLRGLGSDLVLRTGSNNNDPVVIQPVLPQPAQFFERWQLQPNGTVQSYASRRCLDVTDWGTANGTPVQQWDCHGGSNQRWTMTAEGMLRNVGSGRCLDVPSFSTEAGTRLWIWDCNRETNQIWRTR